MTQYFFTALSGLLFFAASLSCAAATMPAPKQIAPDVYAMFAVPEEPSRANGGNVNNTGFIVAKDGVIVIDTGSRDAYGEHILSAIGKITSKPVVLVINTHPDQSAILGDGAFQRRRIPILAHREADRLIAERCATCLKNLQTILGPDLMTGTELVRPTQIIDGGMSLRIAGRALDIIYFGQTHSPGAIAVLDHASGVLFAGGMISIDRIPEVRDAKVDAWIDAIAKMRAMPVKQVVPGHGPVSAPERMRETADYLTALSSGVTKSFRDGIGLAEAASHSETPAFRKWALYDVLHRRNVHYLYLETERLEMTR